MTSPEMLQQLYTKWQERLNRIYRDRLTGPAGFATFLTSQKICRAGYLDLFI